jgi:predicted lipid-binding transport protein (Tim44 family)
MAGGGTTLKTLGIFADFVAGVVFVNYGTLSPCDALRETVRRQDGLARILPDALITAAIEANAGPLTPMKCVGLLLSKQNKSAASAPAPVAPPPPQASISQPPQDPMVIAQNEMVAAMTECRNKRIDGTPKTFVASAQCANPRILQAFSKANYRYMDLIAAFNAKRLQISERVDRKQLTEADAQIETQTLFASIVEAEKQRDSIRK